MASKQSFCTPKSEPPPTRKNNEEREGGTYEPEYGQPARHHHGQDPTCTVGMTSNY